MSEPQRTAYCGLFWLVDQGRVLIVDEEWEQMAERQSTCSAETDARWAEGWIDGYRNGCETGIELGRLQLRLEIRKALGVDEDLRNLRTELHEAIAQPRTRR